EGIAIPHARTEAVKDLLLVVAIVKKGLDFQSLDGKLVSIVFLIVAPEEAKKNYINVLARISRMCRQEEFRSALKESTLPSEILEVIREYDM
ncbi:PTS sugar transporter subunit IIA, partial [candidate division WOR-3 bacterium]|nr:PTS sugar transporter subunit IIA [candidate division WOR-3 bacterium]